MADRSIARLTCARTAFVGRTLCGPVNQPVLLSSFAEFQRIFGGLWQPSPLGYAVEQFFANGGREALVVRVVNAARAVTLTLRAGPQSLQLRAVRPGTREFLRASVDYDNIDESAAAEFNLTIQRVKAHGTAHIEDQEILPRLSMSAGAARYLGEVIAESRLVRLAGPPGTRRPDQTLDARSGLATGYVWSNTDGDDGAPLTDYDLIGSEVERTGLFALEGAEYFNLLCIPPLSRDRDVGPQVLLVAAQYCKARRALLIVDPPAAWHAADDALRGMRRWDLCSENALMYFPRILAHDRLRGRFELFAPGGAVAGMLARSDDTHPVWGSEQADDPILRRGYRPGCLVTEEKRIQLAALGVNTIRAVRSPTRTGVQPRTLAAGAAGTADWQLLAVRRLALFILNSVERGTRWAARPKPHVEVAELAQTQLQEFFQWLHGAGAFGTRPLAESFFVACDRGGSSAARAPPDVYVFQFIVGFAALRSREFHSYRISHSVAGSEVAAVSLNRSAACRAS